MSVNWNMVYADRCQPLWYRVDTEKGVRYLLMVDMDGTLVSMPYFSWALFSRETPGNIATNISFTLRDGRLQCSDEKVKWSVRMLHQVSDHIESHKVVSWLPLKENAALQMDSLPSNVRRKIRKAGKNGIGIMVGGAELSDEFYRVYSRNMHRLGAPAMSAAFYKRVAEAFGREGKFVLATYNGRNIGAALWLQHGDKAEACWFATLEDYNSLYTSYLLWWECIRLSCIAGCHVFSFGRSTEGSGTHQYKSQWGTRNSRLYRNYSHHPGKKVFKFGPVQIEFPGQEFLSGIWKRLPGFMTRWIGPRLAGRFY